MFEDVFLKCVLRSCYRARILSVVHIALYLFLTSRIAPSDSRPVLLDNLIAEEISSLWLGERLF